MVPEVCPPLAISPSGLRQRRPDDQFDLVKAQCQGCDKNRGLAYEILKWFILARHTYLLRNVLPFQVLNKVSICRKEWYQSLLVSIRINDLVIIILPGILVKLVCLCKPS